MVPMIVMRLFRYLSDNGILPCIKVRKNARVGWKKERNTLRMLAIICQKKELQEWKEWPETWTKMDSRNSIFLFKKEKSWCVCLFS